jgi:hypothetical protein
MPQPKSFYPKDLTDQSFKVLRQLVDIVPDGILIGGWGTWVRKHGPTSHDIDLIVDHSGRDVIFALADDHSESSHLGGIKWRAEVEGIHVDLYVPRRSRLGRELKLRVAPLAAYTEEIDGWRVLDIDAHAATKLAALLDRPESQPGEKDRSELFALLPDMHPEAFAGHLIATSDLTSDVLAAHIRLGFDYLKDISGLLRSERTEIDRFAVAAAKCLSQADLSPSNTRASDKVEWQQGPARNRG